MRKSSVLSSVKRIQILQLAVVAFLESSLWLPSVVTAFSVLPPPTARIQHKARCLVDQPPQNTFYSASLSSSTPSRSWQGNSLFPLAATSLEDSSIVSADDLESIQKLFSKFCDANGLMDKEALQSMPPFAQLLEEEDLLLEEWNDIWDAAPKFPDKDASRVDIDSFVQIYRDVDDLFEDEDEDDDSNDIENTDSVSDDDNDVAEDDIEGELSTVYQSICSEDGLISKVALKEWEEVQKLLVEGLLGEDEFDDLWEKAQKTPGTQGEFLDVSGFLSFNVALDGLFEFDDDEEDEDFAVSSDADSVPRAMVVEGDNPPRVLFSQLADKDYLVGMEELKLWVELQEMIGEGNLLMSELQDLYDKYATDESSGKLTEESFQKIYDDIDALFEEDTDEETNASSEASAQRQSADTVKRDLLAFLDLIDEEDEDVLPCGLDATETDQKQVLNIVDVLQQQPTNLVLQKKGNVDLVDVAGSWELVYSSSSAMKFNKGLSGLGGSFPNGRFAGVRQDLTATKFLSDCEYIERIEVNPSSASFDVSVTGSWDLRTSVSLFTGLPSIVLNVEPERVNYGPTSTRADHWKSLGPMNMLDLSYLDEDLRVMRGCTSSDTLFIFKKVA